METTYSPSINIIRDSDKTLKYLVTPNAEKIAKQIANDFVQGFHSFNMIGSYGTGKSSFLWAFEQTLRGRNKYFDIGFIEKFKKIRFLNFIGEFQSIINSFSEQLNVENNLAGNQKILDAIYQEYEKVGIKDGLLVIVIDELGKYLEFAASHQPEKELYFIQQLAEFADDKNRNILFISTVHQSFEGYSNILVEAQKKEWLKVKGRLKEVTFNEPVEQLLLLAAERLNSDVNQKDLNNKSETLIALNKKAYAFSFSDDFIAKIDGKLFPLEIFSASALAIALQKYGQNERSLFTFLQSADHYSIKDWIQNGNSFYTLHNVYEYLHYNFFTFLNSKNNPHFANWSGIRSALERAETSLNKDFSRVRLIITTIGLLNLFSSKGAKINEAFLVQYCKIVYGIDDTIELISELVKYKIISFTRFNQSFKLVEGTDLDIEAALLYAEQKTEKVLDIVGKLNEYFDFPLITAKYITYSKGTPRNFEFLLSEKPQIKTPEGSIDGYINLVFSEQLAENDLKDFSNNIEEAIIFGSYTNTKQIKNLLFEIEKTEIVIQENQEDRVAIKELNEILKHQEKLLNHYVLSNLFSNKIDWYFQGEKRIIPNKKSFNRFLSGVCETVYSSTPIYKNELLNKNKIFGSISSARKNLFKAIVENWDKQDLGFEEYKFPAEKTIYFSLLKENNIHRPSKDGYELGKPKEESSFISVWNECESFLEDAKIERKRIMDLIQILKQKPFKLKQGLIDFWIPIFLFIKRGDYALYDKGTYVPFINETKLYEITRNPQYFELKSFEISEIRLKIFNKYREFLNLNDKADLTNSVFIESIRPFLTFYKNLPDYAKNTKHLSEEALSLRKAIVNAKDPEKIFFEDFPNALKLSLDQLAKSEEALSGFAINLNSAIEDIKYAYPELLNRIEAFVTREIINSDIRFPDYKENLKIRFSSIKEHQLLRHHKVFIQRINSPLNDRDSWLASISQAVIGKPLDQISDEEEQILKDKLVFLVKELDNLRDIYLENTNDKNDLIKLEITTTVEGLKTNLIQIPETKEFDQLVKEIKDKLLLKEKLSIAVLTKLLKEKLSDE
ncbi:MAG: hypothetical protein L3J66_10710 [Bacteroidales bacterium]|nr:hypothetical protein [Bacteroidales bacterium]